MQDKLKEKEFFDQWSESSSYDVFTPAGYNKIINVFRKLAGKRLSKGRKIIDLGCGTGAFSRRFFQGIDAELFGMDISVKAIKMARAESNNINYIVGDVEDLKFKDESFDVVIFSGMLHHFPNIKKSLAEGYRILKKGGCVLSYDPNIKNPFMWLYRHHSSPFFSKTGKTDNERLLSAEEVDSVMKEVGFSYIKTSCIGGVTYKYVKSRRGKLLLPFYNIIEVSFDKLPWVDKYGSFLIGYGEKA